MKKSENNEYKIIYNIEDNEKDEFCIQMLKKNRIKGVLPVVFSGNSIEYNYSHNLRLSEFIEKKITDREILTVLKNICDNYTEIKAHFLKNNMLASDSSEVFINPETYEVYFCILPVYEDYNNHKIENFIRDILFDIETDDDELIYNIMRHLKNKSYSFESFYSYIKEQIEKTHDKHKESISESLPVEDKYEELSSESIDKGWNVVSLDDILKNNTENKNDNEELEYDENDVSSVISLDDMLKNSKEDKNDSKKSEYDENDASSVISLDDMLKNSKEDKNDSKESEYDENNKSSDDLWGFVNNNDNLVELFNENTEDEVNEHHSENLSLKNKNSNDNDIMPSLSTDNLVLSDNLSKNKKAYLFRQVNNEKIDINREYFMLGKYQYASYTFYNDSVSRTHATIITENNEYFIVDNESKNGTFVNGKRIAPNTKIKLNNMDLITLANETLVFYNK